MTSLFDLFALSKESSAEQFLASIANKSSTILWSKTKARETLRSPCKYSISTFNQNELSGSLWIYKEKIEIADPDSPPTQIVTRMGMRFSETMIRPELNSIFEIWTKDKNNETIVLNNDNDNEITVLTRKEDIRWGRLGFAVFDFVFQR